MDESRCEIPRQYFHSRVTEMWSLWLGKGYPADIHCLDVFSQGNASVRNRLRWVFDGYSGGIG